MWWADRIRHRLVDNSPPDAGISADDQASTLIEIAFWSGWLKGDWVKGTRAGREEVLTIGHLSKEGTVPGEKSANTLNCKYFSLE